MVCCLMSHMSHAQTVECCDFISSSEWVCEGSFIYKTCEYTSQKCKAAVVEERWFLFNGPEDSTYCWNVPVECAIDYQCGINQYCADAGTVNARCKLPKCVTSNDCPEKFYCEGERANAKCTTDPEPISYPYVWTKSKVEASLKRLCEALKLHQAVALEAPEQNKIDPLEMDVTKLETLCD